MRIEFLNIYGLFPTGLYLIAWVVAVIFAVRMVRNRGARAERFLLIGTSLMLVSSLITSVFAIIRPSLTFWLAEIENSVRPESIIHVFVTIQTVHSAIALAGIICLVYAFWVKFKIKV